MKLISLLPFAVAIGFLVGSAPSLNASAAKSAMCEQNICHPGTGNCQVSTPDWRCREILANPGCEDCPCEGGEECPF